LIVIGDIICEQFRELSVWYQTSQTNQDNLHLKE
jgi:hypothetical protein